MSLLSRIAEHFVAPPSPVASPAFAEVPAPRVDDHATLAHAAPPPARALVLGDGFTTAPVAAALAAELRRTARIGAAVVCTWSADPASRTSVPAARGGCSAARRLAARLAARELDAAARGRLVWLALPDGPDAALGALARASAAVDAPLVVAVMGARPAAFGALLDDLDLIVLTPPPKAPAAVVALALADLARARPPVVVRQPIPRGTGRWLALAGHGRLRKDELGLAVRALA